MSRDIRITGASGDPIRSVDDWFSYSPPKSGKKHWKDGRSAKELAKAWFRPAVPDVLRELFETDERIAGLALTLALPEHRSAIDSLLGEPPNLDLFALGTAGGVLTAVGVEAKADEPFGPTVNERVAKAPAGSKACERVDALSRALFGRPARAPDGTIDPSIGGLRYQLMTGVGGTLAEAARRGATQAVFVVHEFLSSELDADKVARNAADLAEFTRVLSGGSETGLEIGSLIGPIAVPGAGLVSGDVELFLGKVTTELAPAAIAATPPPSVDAATDISYERLVSERLLDALAAGPFSFLPALASPDGDRLLFLHLLGSHASATSRASLYVGLTKVLDVHEHPSLGIRLDAHPTWRLAGGFDTGWQAWRGAHEWHAEAAAVEQYVHRAAGVANRSKYVASEGRVQALLASSGTAGLSVVDREAVPSFPSQVVKSAVLQALAEPYLDVLRSLTEPPAWHRTSPTNLGSEADLIAVDEHGRLLVIEVKPGSSLKGIAWAPAQVGFYADVFARWVERSREQAVSTLRAMHAQRARLGLTTADRLPESIELEVVPVVAIGEPIHPKALDRMRSVRKALDRAGAGRANAEVWLVDDDGAVRPAPA